MPNTKVSLTLTFEIPSSEIYDVNNDDLKKWLRVQLGVSADEDYQQFTYYGLEDFKPKITDLKIS